MKIKKLITMCLVGLLCLTSIPAYAVDNNGTGGGNNTANSNRGWIGRYWAFQENNGIRLYLADKQGYAVSNVVDFVNYIPETIGSLANSDLAQWYKEYEGYTGKWPIKKEIVYLGGTKSDKAYVETTKGVYFAPKKEGETSPTERTPVQAKMYTYTFLELAIDEWVKDKFPENGTNHIGPYDGLYTYIREGDDPLIPHRIQGPVRMESTGISAYNQGTGKIFMEQMMTPLGKKDGQDVYQVQALLNIELPKSNNKGTEFIGDKAEPLFEFYDSKLKMELQKNIQLGMTYGEAMFKVAQDNSLYIGAEPLGWFVNEVVNPYAAPGANGNDLNAYWSTEKVVYGPVSFASKYTANELTKSLATMNLGKGEIKTILEQCGQTWQWNLAYTAYRLSKADPDLGMQTFEEMGLDPNLVGITDTPYWLSLGFWSDHCQDLGYGIMLFGLTPETSISTSTWDREVYPEDNYSPGKAPEPNETSEGEDYKEKDHTFNIIKFYGEKDTEGSITYTENHVRENTVHNIKIDDELDYKVAGWFTSPNLKIPSSDTESYDDYKDSLTNGQNGDKEGHVIIKPDSSDTTLYVKLIKEKENALPEDLGNVKIVLHEDELSYPYSMQDLKESLDAMWFSFPDKSHSGSGRHGSSDDRWYCDWYRIIDDGSYHMNLKNGFDYNSTSFIGSQGVFAGTEGGKISTSDSERSASISGFETEQLIPNWLFSLYRDKSKDKVTLYPNKNSTEVVNNMSLIGIDSTSYIPSNRIAKENGGSFKDTFSIKYFYESLDKGLSWTHSGCSRHGDTGSYNGTENVYIDMFNADYSTPDNTLTKYYLGKTNVGDTVPAVNNSPFNFDSKSFKAFMSTKLQSNHNIKFYPMVRMTYQTQATGEQDVFVTSANESLVLAPTRVEVGVYRDNAKPGLLLDSTQWSTHAKTQSFLTSEGIADKNSVLPGGAIYDLKTSKTIAGKASDNWVGLHTYQVCIPDANMERLSTTEGVLSESTARQQLNDFLSQVENVLDHYQIVQWVAPGIKTTEDSFKSASPALVCGPGQVNQFGGNTLDRSGKYYLKVDGTGADRSDLDIVGKSQDTTTWTLTSDTDGNVTVANDKGLSLTVSKTEGAGSLLANADIKLLDDKTKVVTNFVNALDRNQGSNREGMKWYNEAFEEIKVIENYAGFQLGFGNGQDARSSALDTRLTGKLEDRRDLYNYSEDSLSEKTRTSQFKTSARSTDGSANGKAPGYIGSMDGLDIVIPNIENLMVSKLFYIPNASVTDLN
ncbi:hypothetical protein LK537_16310 [Lachnoclostridium pacaense]|uniref:hypothetical protein n=1 Tax=Enterocloster hominis (ex Hitch et al. 2024) TaxID=1917870 RepID=UPI001D0FEF85|nr:hypothetical protein [Lachnoclostridium pacaense]MCC2818864.1 hypothetical protein [Lachnoclostridium pacaense]